MVVPALVIKQRKSKRVGKLFGQRALSVPAHRGEFFHSKDLVPRRDRHTCPPSSYVEGIPKGDSCA
ncbi:hypothetical protein PGT21_035036 [Puccinia graminis f. sp. tritici]|uniref:Uncharacterized protein n=1 Tax=Puccinia graminis f. sp. tritici TaxID=56615 RepID=A0A5B0MAQ2_PUCGR|nr:hypothetical protein PGTUg99_022700 [Puccinia graminis f. sp. tritici]KAA1084745.1 hypothetical protein PGT21_035036 [Puccinia graminis f. sp. tritici]